MTPGMGDARLPARFTPPPLAEAAGPWLCLVCEGIPAGLGSAAAGPARGFSSFGLSSLVCLGGFAVVLDQVVRVLLAPGRPWYI